MARLLLLGFVLSAAVALTVQAALPPAKYTDKYDNVNLDRILSNGRILTNYIKCLMDEGPCTSEGRELKRTLPDALETDCSKCSPRQKSAAEKVIQHLQNNRKGDWNRLEAKYDPSGAYRKRFEVTLRQF